MGKQLMEILIYVIKNTTGIDWLMYFLFGYRWFLLRMVVRVL